MRTRETSRLTGLLLVVALLSGCEDVQEAAVVCQPADTPVTIPAGEYTMGVGAAHHRTSPPERQQVNGFRIDSHEVTNRQFSAFVAATGYRTVAERHQDPTDHPGIPAHLLVPGSAVFIMPETPDQPWWHFVPGAQWRHPEGPGSDWHERADHPVVHIAYEDAVAYADWVGGELPTEPEWEYAARGGRDGATFEWGEQSPNQGTVRANIWEGEFPVSNLAEDGFITTAPVGCYPANNYGLFDMTGNVWEWVKTDVEGPQGLIKGGSHLCADNYCRRFRPAAREWQETDFSASHIGFRVVYRQAPPDTLSTGS